MSINNNSKIVTDGLAFYYDANNVKSYVGPPLQNILTQITPAGIGVGTGYVAATGSEIVNIPTLGDTFVNFVTIQNNYTSFTPNSSNCCPSLFQYGSGTLLPSTLYTYAIVYKCESGYTHPNFMYQYDYNGGAYVTEFGLHTTGQRTHLGGGWYWAWATFTTQASVNTLQSSGLWYYQYSSGVDKVTVAKAMMVQGNYTSLHPRYWPALNSTRSNTQAIADLTNNNTITATSLTYANDGTFTFNGSSNYLTIPNTTLGNGNIAWTVSCWMKTSTTTNDLGGGSILSNISGGPVYSMMGVNSGKIVYWTYQSGAWAQKLGVRTVNDNNWHMLTWVNYSNSTMDLYVDGTLDATVANSTSGNNNPVDVIGRSWAAYFPGSIASLSRYTKSLSAAEVQQNFQALRGRYGL